MNTLTLKEGKDHLHIIEGDFTYNVFQNRINIIVNTEARIRHIKRTKTKEPGEHGTILLKSGLYVITSQKEYDYQNELTRDVID